LKQPHVTMPLDAETVFSFVKQIPKGKVATYGQIAALAGYPKHARQVGYLLAKSPSDQNLPWHRVVNAQGKVSDRRKHGYTDYQRLLLEEEGIEFGLHGRINLATCQWVL